MNRSLLFKDTLASLDGSKLLRDWVELSCHWTNLRVDADSSWPNLNDRTTMAECNCLRVDGICGYGEAVNLTWMLNDCGMRLTKYNLSTCARR